ncbi:MAG TPA: hypothetical protein VIE38_03330 [Gaiellaceae bacterium]|jgi:hypothetical protein
MRSRPLIVSVGAIAAFSLFAAGCGGGSSPSGVASVASTTTTSTSTNEAASQNQLLAFSQCMRSNGVPSFPDPQHLAGGNVKLTVHNYGSNPKVQTAMNACGHLLPSGPNADTPPSKAQLAAELSFARCMRTHGLSNFPDPNAQGRLSVEMVQAQGVDVHSPAVLHVVQACLPASHGWLTAAKVREAINNAGH